MLIGYIKKQITPIRFLDKIKYYLGIIKISSFEQGIVFEIPIKEKNMNKVQKRKDKICMKIVQKIQKLKINTVVFSNSLSQGEKSLRELILNKLEENTKEVEELNGRKIIEYMQFDIFKYILKLQEKKIEQEDIHFLIKKDNKLDLSFLEEFIKNCKTVNIVTNDIERYKKIQENLYEKESILMSVSNNKAKALKRAKYVFNINMNEKEIEKFKINRNAIILNVRENFRYAENGFCGININEIKINIPDEYIETFEKISNEETDKFDETKLYEGILMQKLEIEKDKSLVNVENNIKNMHFNVVRNILKKDGIKILKLIGKNGEIDVDDFARLNKLYETKKI